jgi:SAM-dependent methyltransferase
MGAFDTSLIPADFDGEEYLSLHPDVREAGVDPYEHYVRHGANEGRAYRFPPVAPDPRLIVGTPSDDDDWFHRNPGTKRSTIASHTNIWEWVRAHAGAPGLRVLEIGSRAVVSDSLWRSVIPQADYVGFDIQEGHNVDIVGDAHRLSDYFAEESFDVVISFAVFEHLAMPWIVAEEIAKVLAPGGHLCVETHFSYSEHELPWHFFQFNNRALEMLFCPELGFEVIDSGLDSPIVGRFSQFAADYLRGREVPDLYCHSSIIAKKTSACRADLTEGTFDWRSVLRRITTETSYPSASGSRGEV